MGGVVTEEQAINHAQYQDLVYFQSETLYDLIPQASRPNMDPTKPPAETLVDGVAGLIQPPSAAKPAKQQSNPTTNHSSCTFSAEVNVIQSTQTLSNKNK